MKEGVMVAVIRESDEGWVDYVFFTCCKQMLGVCHTKNMKFCPLCGRQLTGIVDETIKVRERRNSLPGEPRHDVRLESKHSWSSGWRAELDLDRDTALGRAMSSVWGSRIECLRAFLDALREADTDGQSWRLVVDGRVVKQREAE
jgi:hypothetical protein